jgi:hypothetical protein
LSVIEEYRPRSRASRRKSNSRFWVIGSPIWTAWIGADSSSAAEENVAPWIPSAPMRPPAMTIRSPGRAPFSSPGRPAIVTGSFPTVPQKTRGFPRNRSSKSSQPRP